MQPMMLRGGAACITMILGGRAACSPLMLGWQQVPNMVLGGGGSLQPRDAGGGSMQPHGSGGGSMQPRDAFTPPQWCRGSIMS